MAPFEAVLEISRLKKDLEVEKSISSKKTGLAAFESNMVQMLKDEINQLKSELEHTKLESSNTGLADFESLEVQLLKAEIKQLKSELTEAKLESSKTSLTRSASAKEFQSLEKEIEKERQSARKELADLEAQKFRTIVASFQKALWEANTEKNRLWTELVKEKNKNTANQKSEYAGNMGHWYQQQLVRQWSYWNGPIPQRCVNSEISLF